MARLTGSGASRATHCCHRLSQGPEEVPLIRWGGAVLAINQCLMPGDTADIQTAECTAERAHTTSPLTTPLTKWSQSTAPMSLGRSSSQRAGSVSSIPGGKRHNQVHALGVCAQTWLPHRTSATGYSASQRRGVCASYQTYTN